MRHLPRCRLRTNVGQRLPSRGHGTVRPGGAQTPSLPWFLADPLPQPPEVSEGSLFPPPHRIPSAASDPLRQPASALAGHSGRIQSP